MSVLLSYSQRFYVNARIIKTEIITSSNTFIESLLTIVRCLEMALAFTIPLIFLYDVKWSQPLRTLANFGFYSIVKHLRLLY